MVERAKKMRPNPGRREMSVSQSRGKWTAWGVLLSCLAGVGMATAQSPVLQVGPSYITTVAGTGTGSTGGDGGLATAANLHNPMDMKTDAAGNLYILDSGNGLIREVAAGTGIITTIAGTASTYCTPATAVCGDGGAATAALLGSGARAIYVTPDGSKIYIADYGTNRVRLISNGIISTIAGTGTASSTGNGGQATAATLNGPRGVYVDASGKVYIADTSGNEVRVVNSQGVISIFAGGGSGTCTGATDSLGDGCAATSAKLNAPMGLSMDAAGNLYIDDEGDARIRMVTPGGVITTVAGNGTSSYQDNVVASQGELNLAQSVAADAAGNFYIADYSNNRIRAVYPYISLNGNLDEITTLAGTGVAGYNGDGVAPTSAQINGPHNVALDSIGNVYIADYNNNRIRKVNLGTTQLSFGTVIMGQSSTAHNITLTNIGNAALVLNGINMPPQYVQTSSGSTDCNNNTTLQTGQTCTIAVVFSPTQAGAANVSLVINSNASNAPQSQTSISLSGTGQSTAPVAQNQQVTVALNTPTPITLSATGQGTITYSILTPPANGTLSGTPPSVTYTPNPNYSGSDSFTFVANNGTPSNPGTININVSPASSLTFTVPPASPVMAYGNAGVVTVSELAGSSVATAAADPITLTVSGPNNYQQTYTATAVSGVASFDLTAVALTASGVYTYTAQAGPLTPAQATETVKPGVAAAAVSPGIITTIAGNGTAGFAGDNGQAVAAELHNPESVRLDAAGNLYIWDSGNAVIREVTAGTGVINTIAGTSASYCGTANPTAACGDGGPATAAQISSAARSLFVTPNGQIYIADTGINRIRLIANGNISTVAGTGTAGNTGNGQAATQAQLNGPRGVYLDGSGNIYISDTGNNEIRLVNAQSGNISVLAGGGSGTCAGATDSIGDGCPATSAKLNTPISVWMDAAGNLYINDAGYQRIRKVAPNGIITTVAGNGTAGFKDNVPATQGELSTAQDVVVDAPGDIFIADYFNNRVRAVYGNGILTTVAGNGTGAYGGDNGPATAAQVYEPHGVVQDATGNLYIAEYGSARIRKVDFTTSALNYGIVYVNQTSPVQTVTVTSTGTAGLQITGILIPPGYTQVASGGTDCTSNLTLPPGQNCQVALTLAPAATGVYDGTLQITMANAANLTQNAINVALTGQSIYNSTTPTTTTLTATPSAIIIGQSVQLQATVTASGGVPTGSVSFLLGTQLLGTTPLVNGAATLTTSALPAGTDAVTAIYNSDPTYAVSTSAPLNVMVYTGPPAVTISATPASATVISGHGTSVTFTVNAINGFSGLTTFNCTSLPANMSCTFLPAQVNLQLNQSYSVLLSITTTTTPPTPIAMAVWKPLAYCVLTPFVLFGLRRRRSLLALCLVGAASLALLCSQGCTSNSASIKSEVVAPGTYTINLVETNGSTTNTFPFTITVQ